MATTPVPLPQANSGDPGMSGADPRLILQQLALGRTQGQGTTSVGPNIPMPQPIGQPVPRASQSGVAQGSYASRGAHQRASMQNLVGSVQNLVSTAAQVHQQQQNKQLGQKFQSLTGSVSGVQAGQEKIRNGQSILKQDPNSDEGRMMVQEGQQMVQHNQSILNQLLDPNTPEGKKNVKLFNKGFGFDDNNADTPERAAAIQAMREQGLNSGAASLLSRIPTGVQMSPQTQVQGQMVQAGVTPKAATQGQILTNENKAAGTLVQDQQKQDKLAVDRTRLGLDENNKPLPLESLPLDKQAKVASERAGDQLKAAQTGLAQARQQALLDPKSPQNQAALMRATGYEKIAQAMALRAQVGMLNYQMNAFGTDAQGNPLPGSESVGGQTVGMRAMTNATRVLNAQAAFTDVDGALDNLDAAAKTLTSTGQSLNDPRLVKLMTDPHFKSGDMQSFGNWISSEVGASLSPEQRDYLIAQRQAKENIPAMRRYTGSGVAQKQIDMMTSTLPGSTTPDYDMAHRQIESVRSQLNRLHTGIPQLNVPNTPASAKAGLTYDPATGTVK